MPQKMGVFSELSLPYLSLLASPVIATVHVYMSNEWTGTAHLLKRNKWIRLIVDLWMYLDSMKIRLGPGPTLRERCDSFDGCGSGRACSRVCFGSGLSCEV